MRAQLNLSRTAWVIGMFILTFSATASEATQPGALGAMTIVGLDAQRKETQQVYDADQYQSQLRTIIMSTQDAVLPVLSRRTRSIQGFAPNGLTMGPWQLGTFVLGIGFSLEEGLGPIFSLKQTARLRLIYSNNDHPVFPDF